MKVGPTAHWRKHRTTSACGPVTAMRRAIGTLLLALHLAVPLVHAATTAPTANALRVITTPIAPFVLPDTDPLAGFSIDMWDAVARRMHVDFTLQVVAADDRFSKVERGDADVATGLLVMTPEDERRVDFTHPYLDSGLQIMVRAQREGHALELFDSIPWRAIGELFGVAILIMLLLANVLWLIERRNNPSFRKKYLAAIGEGLWGSMLIIATGEHGDRNAPNVIKRIAVVAMWLLGVVLVAQLTATVTSSQIIARFQSEIRGPADLPGKTIAATPGTIAGDYLTGLGLPFTRITTPDEGIRMLTQGEVQAVVLNSAALQYLAAKRGKGVLQVVGPIFRNYKIGFVVREGSPLRKQINEALLAMYADGTYEDIYAKWFSRGNR
jgi:ABC-type amino acid transport substrate-binding protein